MSEAAPPTPAPTPPPRLVLHAGAREAQVLPAAGGALARVDLLAAERRRPLMRGTDDDAAGPLDCAGFPLVPFCNRIRGGSFGFREETIRLAPNMPPDPSPLHGQGWRLPWDVVSHGPREIELRLRHAAGEWPWDYEARQVLRLDPGGLALTLACTNLSTRPMPCGLGYHPYHPCDGATRLATTVAGAWTVDAAVLPLTRVPATGRYDLGDRAICGQDLDNCFDGWGGTATIRWGGQAPALRLTSADAGHFQVYAPASGGLFVAEPVQHANCALNAPEAQWPGLGMAVLGPGESRSLAARWDVILPSAVRSA